MTIHLSIELWGNYCSSLLIKGNVLFQQLRKKNRVRIIEYFVDVAKECVNIGNFNSLMAIIGKYDWAKTSFFLAFFFETVAEVKLWNPSQSNPLTLTFPLKAQSKTAISPVRWVSGSWFLISKYIYIYISQRISLNDFINIYIKALEINLR